MIDIRRSALIGLGLLALVACGQPAATADAAGAAAPAAQPAEAAQAPAGADLRARFTDNACFARGYDDAHLAAHPRQMLQHFFLAAPGAEWAALNTPEQFHLGLGFSIRDSTDIFIGVAICTPRGEGAACGLEGDGGEFTITPQGARLRLDIARMELEGQEGFSPNLADSDDRVVLLDRSDFTDCLVD